VLHTGAVLSLADEARFLEERDRVPYGAVLWPAAIALAHELASRAETLRSARLLELGAGIGLPGIVAASLGARVVQTDRHPVALAMCARNAERNHVAGIEHRRVDWGEWTDVARYDLIVGSDILYAESKHDDLRRIFAANLSPGGRVLVADPLRPMSVRFLEAIEADGWTIGFSKWNVGESGEPRQVAIYDLTMGE
jgi:methyltransferase-like protein 23